MSLGRTETSSRVGSTSSLSRYTNASNNALHVQANGTIGIPEYRPTKRRKVAGLNARFDRMLSCGSISPASSQKRMQSSSTSSVSSHDVPKTPVYAHNNSHIGRLGEDVSVFKMTKRPRLPQGDSDGGPKLAEPPSEPKNRLPDWLASMFCSLEAGHPLRGLLSPSRIHAASRSNSPSTQLLGVSHDEELFAFSPFELDKQEVPDPAYRTDSTSDVQRKTSSVPPTESALLHPQSEVSTDVLPFPTPGCFAPVRRLKERLVVDGTVQKQSLIPVPQQVTSHAANMMCPSALPASSLRVDNEMRLPQFTRAFSGITQDNEPPSDFEEHGICMSHNCQVFRGDNDNFNVYATPGPTFTCSSLVFFDSPTKGPSLSDPPQLESYELDIDAIDFRWRPYLRSNVLVSDTDRHSMLPSSPPGCAVPNQAGDQNGWGARFSVDQEAYGASSNEFPLLLEDVELGHVNDVGGILPSNNLMRPWSPPINDIPQQARPAPPLAPSNFLSPLRDQPKSVPHGENMYASEESPLLHDEETSVMESEAYDIRPLTPVRQVSISPPSAPRKVQQCGAPRVPLRKTSSVLSWMIPLKSSNHTAPLHDNVNYRLWGVPANSHDRTESWSETG